jgi:hypothetical protein
MNPGIVRVKLGAVVKLGLGELDQVLDRFGGFVRKESDEDLAGRGFHHGDVLAVLHRTADEGAGNFGLLLFRFGFHRGSIPGRGRGVPLFLTSGEKKGGDGEGGKG